MLLLGLLFCAPSLAQEPKYRLTVEAPSRELRELLSRGLQLARWQDDAQLTPALLRRLVDEGSAEARAALEPFARGAYGAYRKREATELYDALDR